MSALTQLLNVKYAPSLVIVFDNSKEMSSMSNKL